MTVKSNLICIGEFVAPHGVRGDIRLYPYSDDPSQYLSLKTFFLDNGTPFSLESIKAHKRVYVIHSAQIKNVDEAEALRGKKIYVSRDMLPELPEGEYFHFEMIGLPVFHAETGEKIGTVANIISTGANDVYEVQLEDGKNMLVPAIRDVIKKIDIPAGRIEILPQKEW